MSYYSKYRWCAVPKCKNTSVKTPDKLFIQVPIDLNKRETWFKVARRNLELLHSKTRLCFCEDHFDLENDMENYMEYKIIGSVKRIRLKPNCLPSRFDCNKKQKSVSNESHLAKAKRMKKSSSKDYVQDHIDENYVEASSSCIEDSQTALIVPSMENNCEKAVQFVQIQENTVTEVDLTPKHREIQASIKLQCRSKQIKNDVKHKDKSTLLSKFIVSTASSFLKTSMKNAIKPSTSQSAIAQKLGFTDENSDSDSSRTLSIEESTVDKDNSSSEASLFKTTLDTSVQSEKKKLENINRQSTLSKIISNPIEYIFLSKNLYFLIDLIKKHTNFSEHNILLCLMKIKLNRSFTELGDDFDLSVTQASYIFLNTMPGIVKVLLPFIKQISTARSIEKKLPICIIHCLEIEIQKPSKVIHQALSWSEYKKTNTIKYLISCTTDGLVNFVSNSYSGSISDVYLLENSKFLECLQPGSCILADRGFKHLEVFLSQKGFVLLRPPRVPAGMKLSKTEIKEAQQIASLRIHMERVIRRLRKFNLLKKHSVINSNLIDMLDLCIKTACALVNLQDLELNEL